MIVDVRSLEILRGDPEEEVVEEVEVVLKGFDRFHLLNSGASGGLDCFSEFIEPFGCGVDLFDECFNNGFVRHGW